MHILYAFAIAAWLAGGEKVMANGDSSDESASSLPEGWRRMLEASSQENRDFYAEKDHHPLVPPWLEYPDIPRTSIGWRMGAGEGYMDYFIRRYSGMDAEQREAYRIEHPAPIGWLGFYENTEAQISR